jgi:hypothetical protein
VAARTLACRENPELSVTSALEGSRSAGSVLRVKTFWTSLGPVAIRKVIERPSKLLMGVSSLGSKAR